MSNISRSKGNQAMKFDQLIECNMRNIFLEKSYAKCSGETNPRPFSEKLKLGISLTHSLKFYTVCFYWMPCWGLQTTCFYLIRLFQKINKGLELVCLSHFLQKFWRKLFLLLYCINRPRFIVWLPLLREISANMCIATVCEPGYDVMNLEVNLIFLIRSFSLHDQKVMTKT